MKYIKKLILEREDIGRSLILDDMFDAFYNYINNVHTMEKIGIIPRVFQQDGDIIFLWDDIPNLDIEFIMVNFSTKHGFGNGHTELKDGRSIETIYIERDGSTKLNTEYFLDIMNKNEFEIKHEFSHLYDDLTHHKNKDSTTDKLNSGDTDGYYNSRTEVNAYYMMAANRVIKEFKKHEIVVSSFDRMMAYIRTDYNVNHFLNKLNEKNKKNINKRFYDLYHKLKNNNMKNG